MAFQPISRPTLLPENSLLDPAAPRGAVHEGEFASPATLSRLTDTLASLGGGASSAELALDIVLNEIVQDACLSTHASGAALGLMRDGRMVCRATTGTGGPNLGMELDEHSGLSGIALQTRQLQLCEDSETDSRVDAAACRDLGIRSILVVPILEPLEKLSSPSSSVLGVLEVFSPYPGAFGNAQAGSLTTFCSRVLELFTPASPTSELPTEIDQSHVEYEVSQSSVVLVEEDFKGPAGFWTKLHNYWTVILTSAVIGSAFLLGWLWGYGNGKVKKPAIAKSVAVQEQVIEEKPAAQSAAAPSAAGLSRPAASATAHLSTERTGNRPSAGDLVVYEKGKMVYLSQSHGDTATSIVRRPRLDVAKAVDTAPRVIRKVSPKYPESARQQRIAGPVEVLTLVDKSGAVEQVMVISGDPMLAEAASVAIARWRFQPLLRDGKAVAFETRVKVEFKLPEK